MNNIVSNAAEKMTTEQIQSLPPMLRQYQEYKQRYSDCLLLFQVGDFYESFFEDAVTIAKVINLTLTSRTKNAPDPVPMAGVPMAVIDSYLERLVKLGYSVAVVSQCEDDSVKSGVGRKLDRIVTPGITLQCDLDSDQAPVIASVYVAAEDNFSLAYSSVQTGEIIVAETVDKNALLAELMKLMPAEIIIPRDVANQRLDKRSSWIKRIEESLRSATIKFRNLHYAEASERVTELKGYSALAVAAKKAVRLLIDYVDETTVGIELPFQKVLIADASQVMSIDASARRTLEIIQNSKDGDTAGSLFGVLNHTRSIGGSRLLRTWLLNPLINLRQIVARQDAVTTLIENRLEADGVATSIKYITDFERISARLELNIVSPRELAALRDSLAQLPQIKANILKLTSSQLLKELASALLVSPEIEEELLSQLAESPASNLKEGGIFRDGYNQELDHLRTVRAKGHSWIAELENKERTKNDIPSLKIRYNALQGYYIEVTKTHLSKVPDYYVKKQSTVNGERFVTDELKRMESELLGAEAKQYNLERRMFDELRDKLRAYTPQLRAVYASLCQLDVLLSLAEVASLENYVRPEMVEDNILEIVDGRHPVVAEMLKGSFVANSLVFSHEKQCAMLTGPNMGGKSTFLRQNGLIVVMAQIGSFVPASRAVLGIVDKLFARMGASDDLLEGESTFMVEMREAAHIVTNATSRSLLLIDEIGRGTATSDGRAIARAILEWVVEKISCRTLFATHFHELTELDCYRSTIQNLSVGVVENGDNVLFTHEIKHCPANRSYGLEVAKLAGLPTALVERARELLSNDEFKSQEVHTSISDNIINTDMEEPITHSIQFEMFPIEPQIVTRVKTKIETKVVPPADYQKLSDFAKEVANIDINQMTPLNALNCLSALKLKVIQ